jgi:ABC-2 type transport system ATP-binding protein
VLSRVVGVLDIEDIKIVETNTDDIVREIYKTGSAVAPPEMQSEAKAEETVHHA